MILLVSEHRTEIEPLLKLYPFEKKGKLLHYRNVAVFTNYGMGGLNLGYNVANILSNYPEINISVLFGFAGTLGNSPRLGELFVCDRVKLMHKKTPIFNPIVLPSIREIEKYTMVSLLDEYDTDSGFLRLFADAVDREGYFFAKAVKSLGRIGLIIKTVSDNNTKSSIMQSRKATFEYDVSRLKNILEQLLFVDKDELMIEIFEKTGILETDILKGIKKLFVKRRLSFSKRQRIYKRILINSSVSEEKSNEKIGAVFVEKGVQENRIKISADIYRKYEIDDYVSYFHNLKNRNSVIFANKKGEFLRRTPDNYTPQNGYGYSILNAYNCIYDCSYCFLKGYFKSFNPVIFLNYEDYFRAISDVLKKDRVRPLYFYAGTFSDSLALEYFVDFNLKLMEFFSALDENVFLEFRTKSVNIEWLLDNRPTKNVIIAFSLNPQKIIDRYEHLTPSLERRLEAIKKVDDAGYKVGIRLDPVFVRQISEYGELVESLKNIKNLHSVEIGFLRYDKNDYANMLKINPSILKNLVFDKGMYRYPPELRQRAVNFFREHLGNFYMNMEY